MLYIQVKFVLRDDSYLNAVVSRPRTLIDVDKVGEVTTISEQCVTRSGSGGGNK